MSSNGNNIHWVEICILITFLVIMMIYLNLGLDEDSTKYKIIKYIGILIVSLYYTIWVYQSSGIQHGVKYLFTFLNNIEEKKNVISPDSGVRKSEELIISKEQLKESIKLHKI